MKRSVARSWNRHIECDSPTQLRGRIWHIVCAVLLLAKSACVLQADDCHWQQCSTSGPPVRENFAMTFDELRGVTVVFGGHYSGGYWGDTWTFDGTTWLQHAVVGPSPRASAEMTFDSWRAVVVLFGGGESGLLGDTWEWDGQNWEIRQTVGPRARVGHALSYDDARHCVVMFGGLAGVFPEGLSGETWEWDGGQWLLQQAVNGPSPRYGHGMAYDKLRQRTVMFGGVDETNRPLGDTWEWDGNAWTLVTSNGPPSRASVKLAYNPVEDNTVLFGGITGNQRLNDTWTWNGTDWMLVHIDGPPARYVHGLCYDSVRWQGLVFGGYSNGYMNDTWRLPSPIRVRRHPESRQCAIGSQVELTVDAVGATPLSYQWSKDGVPLEDGETLHGTHARLLEITSVVVADAGSYSVAVGNECSTRLSDSAWLSVRCAADIFGDGVVDLADLALFLAHFGECRGDAEFFSTADIDGRGCVDLADLTLLLSQFGEACP